MKLASILSASLCLLTVAACSGKGSGFGNEDGGGDGGAGFGDGQVGFGDTGSGGDGSSGGCNPDPGNFDVPGNNCDDDGDGTVDNPQGACDNGLAPTGPAADFAKAMGLCQMATGGKWGLVSATYTRGYNATQGPADDNQHGIMPKYGNKVKPRQGSTFGILSSGYAREYDQCTTSTDPMKGGCPMDPNDTADQAPPGYPKAVNGCTPATDVHDAAGITLKIKVPNNAKGVSFDFDFFSGEWPEWVCSTFNDSFVAWLNSTAFTGKAGDLNVSYDSNNNPINVNNSFFQSCSPANASVGCVEAGGNNLKDKCSLGDSELQGTGFYDPGQNCGQSDSGGGSTSWLTTTAPVAAGETITIQFIIWDTGDQAYDSNVLIDNWTWTAGDTVVGTKPVN